MNVIIKEVPTPMFRSFTLCGKPNLELLKETKVVHVHPHAIGKTRVSTSIQFGEFCNKINFQCEGIKTKDVETMNSLDFEKVTSHYFVKSKKQGLNEYKDYVTKVVTMVIKDIFHIELDELTIELETNNF